MLHDIVSLASSQSALPAVPADVQNKCTTGTAPRSVTATVVPGKEAPLFGVWGLRLGVSGLGSGVWGLRCGIWGGRGFKVWGLGCNFPRFQGCRVRGPGFRVQPLRREILMEAAWVAKSETEDSSVTVMRLFTPEIGVLCPMACVINSGTTTFRGFAPSVIPNRSESSFTMAPAAIWICT